MQDLISVIVPIYNVEDYIDRCVTSIVKQTYENLEIILVDDGSKDNSPIVCDTWADRDPRIKVIHKDNGGLSDARNAGIKSAAGTYYSFIDGDDEIHPNMIERLYNEAVYAAADISMCRMKKIEATRSYETRGFPSDDSRMKMTGIEAMTLLFRDVLDCSACLKLYRRELFEDLVFPYGKTNEDFAIMYKLFKKADAVVYISDVLYYYYFRENSITSSEFSEKQFDKVDNCIEMLEYIESEVPEVLHEAKGYMLRQTMYLLKTLCINGMISEYKVRYKLLRKILIQNTLEIIISKQLSLKEKAMYICLAYFPRFYTWQNRHQ